MTCCEFFFTEESQKSLGKSLRQLTENVKCTLLKQFEVSKYQNKKLYIIYQGAKNCLILLNGSL